MLLSRLDVPKSHSAAKGHIYYATLHNQKRISSYPVIISMCGYDFAGDKTNHVYSNYKYFPRVRYAQVCVMDKHN